MCYLLLQLLFSCFQKPGETFPQTLVTYHAILTGEMQMYRSLVTKKHKHLTLKCQNTDRYVTHSSYLVCQVEEETQSLIGVTENTLSATRSIKSLQRHWLCKCGVCSDQRGKPLFFFHLLRGHFIELTFFFVYSVISHDLLSNF